MSIVGDAINEVRLALGEVAVDIKPRTCTVSTPTGATPDAYGEQASGTPSETAGVPASFEALKAFERAGDAGTLAGADHRLELPYIWGGERLLVPANSTVIFDADDFNPALTFRVTGQLESSSGIWQQVAAVLVQ